VRVERLGAARTAGCRAERRSPPGRAARPGRRQRAAAPQRLGHQLAEPQPGQVADQPGDLRPPADTEAPVEAARSWSSSSSASPTAPPPHPPPPPPWSRCRWEPDPWLEPTGQPLEQPLASVPSARRRTGGGAGGQLGRGERPGVGRPQCAGAEHRDAQPAAIRAVGHPARRQRGSQLAVLPAQRWSAPRSQQPCGPAR